MAWLHLLGRRFLAVLSSPTFEPVSRVEPNRNRFSAHHFRRGRRQRLDKLRR